MLKPILTGLCFFQILFMISCRNNDPKSVEKKPVTDTPGTKNGPLNSYAPVLDVSPMDMAYFPVEYPKLKMTKKVSDPPLTRVIYSRPHRQGRKIFGDLLKYGSQWRLGANEATEIQFFKQVTIQNKSVAPGRYVMYCIPYENKWTIALNSYVDTWGLVIDSTYDVHRFDVPTAKSDAIVEDFTMIFEKSESGADLLISWDDVLVKLPFKF